MGVILERHRDYDKYLHILIYIYIYTLYTFLIYDCDDVYIISSVTSVKQMI